MFIKRLRPNNVLSFADCSVELRNLNVLIGPNGSGKSNLIHVIDLLRQLPGDFISFMVNSRGADLWLRLEKGIESGMIEVSFLMGDQDWEYSFSFAADGPIGAVRSEMLQNPRHGIVISREPNSVTKEDLEVVPLKRDFLSKSVFGMFRGPEEASIIPKIAAELESIRIYRDFDVGARSAIRVGLPAVRSYGRHLAEDGGNLAEVLQTLDHSGRMEQLNRWLEMLNADAIDVRQEFHEGRLIVTLKERDLSRRLTGAVLSEGTLRFLCLAAILMHPDPPPLVCIEEPEKGLHPDAIRMIGDMLVEASSKTQVIVTTHSPALVDCFSSEPEVVVVCEKNTANETIFSRLTRLDLETWLEKFSLGDVWQRGAIGGVR